ncbi:MAG: PorP/SprF family type IX secretion system membrane protein [Saprospiraceae bacterium]|nr:PorP/SprF family type IX secretion system membrane protein [Saprospiraceae bacterium]
MSKMSFGQDPHYSQFYLNPLYTNPALIGVFEGNYRAIINYRDQWSSVLGSTPFRTFAASLDAKFKIRGDDYVGAAFNFFNDQAGVSNFRQSGANLGLSYMKQLGGSRYSTNEQFLIAGAQLGFNQFAFNGNNLWFSRQFDYGLNLPNSQLPSNENIAETVTGKLNMQFNAGILWYALFDDNLSIYFGGALQHINQPNISLYNSTAKQYRKWTIHGGGQFPLNKNFSILPAVIVNTQGPSLETMFGSNVRYSNNDLNEVALRIGAWMRFTNQLDKFGSESLIFSTILEMNQMMIGLSYDINNSLLKKSTDSRGAFEVSFTYVGKTQSRFKVHCPKF